MPEPLVSIVIPTYNRKELLAETLASVRAQTYARWEAVVVDDGSSDGTLDDVPPQFADEPRVRFFAREGERGNANVCRNQGFAKSTGDYVIFLDSDDLLAPECLERRVRDMEAHPDLGYIAYLSELFEREPGDLGVLWNVFTTEPDLLRFLRVDNPWSTTGPIWRRWVLEQHRWDETMLSWQDGDFHRRVLASGVPYGRVNAPDHHVRRAPTSADNLSRRSASLEHLACHARGFVNAAALLVSLAHKDDVAPHIAASSVYGKCRDMLLAGHASVAAASWGELVRVGGAGERRGREGRVVFGLARVPGMRRAALTYLRARWSDYDAAQRVSVARKVLVQTRSVGVVEGDDRLAT